MSRNSWGAVLACVCMLGFVSLLAGAEKEDIPSGYGPRTEEERQEAERIKFEDAQDEKTLGDLKVITEEGKLHLQNVPNIDTAPWVIGHLSTTGRAYALLLDNPALFSELRALNGQKVKLNGRLRVGNKYFVVTGIYQPLKVPTARPKRGGL